MAQTNYSRGYKAEARCMRELEREGLRAFRSAGSKGAWDVVGISRDEVRLVQVKRVKAREDAGPVLRAALRGLEKIEVPVSVIQQAWVWIDDIGWVKGEARWPGGEP